MAVKHLDTKEFDTIITQMRGFIVEFTDIKTHFNQTARELIEHWEGKGRNAFQKDYTEVQLNLEDLTDIMSDIADSIVEAEKAYFTGDSEFAKNIQS